MKTHILFLLGICFCISHSHAQSDPWEYIDVDHEPKPSNLNLIHQDIGYPYEALTQQIEGDVIARIHVDPEGKYVEHILIKSPDTILSQAVEKQIHRIEFMPALKDGKSLPYWTNVPFSFSLADNSEDALKELGDKIRMMPNRVYWPKNLQNVIKEIGYPPQLYRKGVEGTVIARIHVDPSGKYVRHELIQKVHPTLDKAVSRKLKKLEFVPMIKHGKAVAYKTEIPFTFKVHVLE